VRFEYNNNTQPTTIVRKKDSDPLLQHVPKCLKLKLTGWSHIHQELKEDVETTDEIIQFIIEGFKT
jgi:hypothetical protein